MYSSSVSSLSFPFPSSSSSLPDGWLRWACSLATITLNGYVATLDTAEPTAPARAFPKAGRAGPRRAAARQSSSGLLL